MAYSEFNFKSKKDLKEAVATGKTVRCFQPGLGPNLSNFTGTVCLSGPHFPKPHSWYAEVQLKDGVVTRVK